MPDGKIVFSTELDNKGLEKELSKTTNKIRSLEDQIDNKQKLKMPLLEQSKQLQVELDKAKAKLYEMQNSPVGMFSKDQLSEQKETVGAIQSQWTKVQNRVDSYDRSIQEATLKLEKSKESAGIMAAQLSQTGPSSERMATAMARAQKSANRFALRMREVIRSALVFTLISQSLAKFRDWMGKVIQSNDEAAAATARLKGALLTMAQPLVNVVLPAFVALVNILTRVVTAIAGVMSALFGTTIDQSKAAAEALHEQTEALDGTGSAAKKAGKSLASFDEINKLSSGGSAAASSGATAPAFDFGTETMGTDMERILGLAKLVGTALLAWKLPGTLTDTLGTFIGMLVAIEGGILLAKGAMDAWNNGVSWDNIRDMLLGAFLLVAGLSAVLGATAGGIALVVSGFAMMVVAIKDVLENGWTLQNLFLTIAGILTAGLGISVLTGSWIPMLVAAIGSILLAITVLTGNGGQLIENLKQIFHGFITFVDGILTGDLNKIFEGAKEMVKGVLNATLTIVGSLVNAIIRGLNWLIEKINSISFSVPDWVPGIGGMSWSPSLPSVAEWDIPQLAQGAVIPPNREFLAVLGDQKSGTNIETPLSTMVQAFKQAMAETGGGGNTTVILELDGQQLGKVVFKAYNQESRRVGVNLAGVR